jgi:ParB-like chromosome segregation protein Spo0J
MNEFKMIPLKDIHPDENQPRKFYDETLQCRNSLTPIREKGVIQPIVIRPKWKGL